MNTLSHLEDFPFSDLAAAASYLESPQNPLQAQYRCRKWDPNRHTGLNLTLNSDSSNFQFWAFFFFFFFNQIVPHSRIAELLWVRTVGLGQVIIWVNTVVRVFYFLETFPSKNHLIRWFMNAGSQTGTDICMYRTQRSYLFPFLFLRAFLVAQLVKNQPAIRKTWVGSLGWEDPLEKGKATHSRILAWRIPWTV